MRICFVNPYFYPYTGGIESRILETGKRLARRNHECYVLTSDLGYLPPSEDIHGVHVVRLPARPVVPYNPPPILMKGGASEVYRALMRISPDVVDFHYRWSPAFTIAMHRFMNMDRGMVFTFHNMFGEGTGILRPLSFLNDILFSVHLKRYDIILCVSKYVKHDLIARGFNAEKILVIPNGIDLSITEKIHTTDCGYGLYVGRLVQTKGLDTLLRALALVKKRGVNSRFKIVGDGPQKDRLMSLKKRLQLESVEFLGHLPDEEKWRLYAGCSYFVLPSLLESFGLALLEAMAFGKPVIATKVGGIPEIVDNAGLLVSPRDTQALADAITCLVTEPQTQVRLSQSAKKKVQGFTWDTISLHLETVYHKSLVLARRRHTHEASKLKEISTTTPVNET